MILENTAAAGVTSDADTRTLATGAARNAACTRAVLPTPVGP